MGRHAKLPATAIERIDAWIAARTGWRKDFKVLASELGVSYRTIIDASRRERAYRGVPRG